jgi:hypothetical protein
LKLETTKQNNEVVFQGSTRHNKKTKQRQDKKQEAKERSRWEKKRKKKVRVPKGEKKIK